MAFVSINCVARLKYGRLLEIHRRHIEWERIQERVAPPSILYFSLMKWMSLLLRVGCVCALPVVSALALEVPDTLEIHLIKVAFQYETTDNSLTTGRGTFDSDADTASANYSLDPQGNHSSAAYWQAHLDFAKQYYQKVSGGKLAIVSAVYPRSQTAYTLDKFIIDYNRTARKSGEKVAEYDEARIRDYMGFVSDALHKAADDNDSPFAGAPTAGSKRKRVYMIVHAGASRLVDGGSLGTTGADTPGDFMDVFVDSTSWMKLKSDADRAADSVGVVVNGDTLREVMVVSETASQDGLNWGVNGIIVNQIGRILGLPNTYDVNKGISRLGYFDVMDFAGYNAGNGFFPVLPSAWLRAYMGWASVREVRPGADGSVTVNLAAAGSGLGTEIIKVPIGTDEYLLIENRQRSGSTDGKVTVTLTTDFKTSRTVTLPVDSLRTLFLDSICGTTAKSCKVNSKKAKGVVTSISSVDASLPGSGIAVWHVNDWYLRAYLPYGVVNYWGGDTLRDHQYGIALAEADGVLSIGKAFKNALGQATYDYGSGADLLPHQRYTDTTTGAVVKALAPTGYGNTASTQGAYSGVRISVETPSGAVAERTANSFMGDSVRNWRALTLPVRISWESYPVASGQWPRALVGLTMPRGLVSVAVTGRAEPVLAVASAQGALQLFDARGNAACATDTLVSSASSTLADSATAICRAGRAPGAVLGLAAAGNHILSAHAGAGLYNTTLHPDNAAITWLRDSLALAKRTLAGPLVQDSSVWVADSATLRAAKFYTGLAWTDSVAWPSGFVPQELALCGDVDEDGVADVVAVGALGKLAVRGSADNRVTEMAAATASDARFRLACTDFNRDGVPDAFVLGNAGHGWFTDLRKGRLLAPQRSYKRGHNAQGKPISENSAPALADVNDDGFPEAVFLGYNNVYAVDSSGLPLQGFPVTLAKGEPLYVFLADPLVLDVQGDGVLDILVPGNGGSVYAVTAKGKLLTDGWPLAAGSYADSDTLYPLSLFALAADSLTGPELYALHRKAANGFSLGSGKASALGWALPGNGNARTNYLDPSALGKTTVVAAADAITEFFVFPNPVRRGKAAVRFRLQSAATSATVDFFDITGLPVFSKTMASPGAGANQIDPLDLSQLGSDVYSVRLTVRFVSGKKVERWDRVGVVR
jgi:M6 family metalloprotease-like protein